MESIADKPELGKRKRGEVRSDGRIFWAIMSGKERWLTAEKFAEMQESCRQKYLANSEKIKAKLREKYAADPDKYKGKVMDRRYANIEKSREREAQYREKNKDQVLEWGREWYKNNKEKYRAWSKAYEKKYPEKKLAYYKKWKSNNMEKHLKWRREHMAKRVANDPMFAFRQRLRSRMWGALNRKNQRKTVSVADCLQCSPEFFLNHIIGLFLPGMTIENRGLWELDHIIPLSIADDEAQMIELACYANIQPLWAIDNLNKSDTVPENFEEILDRIASVLKIPSQELKIRNSTALVGSLAVREMS